MNVYDHRTTTVCRCMVAHVQEAGRLMEESTALAEQATGLIDLGEGCDALELLRQVTELRVQMVQAIRAACAGCEPTWLTTAGKIPAVPELLPLAVRGQG